MEKKEYETPSVTRIEIGFSDRIVALGCAQIIDNQSCIDGPRDS